MGLDKEDRRLWRAVLRTVRPFPLTAPQTKLLVGVSGGADSLALLHLLWRQLGAAQLVVAHLDHGLRPEAQQDAQFVADLATSWQLPCISQQIDVAEVADTHKLSLEAAGRLMRYQFLGQQATQVGATAVVVGHHADDQAETILLHLLRGSGSAGLRGMLPVGVLPGDSEVVLVRPFLQISRAEIEAYCARHSLQPRHDSSNENVQFFRNRIRHELLPLLRTYSPHITANLQQLAIITADAYAAQLTQLDRVWPQLVAGQGDDWLLLDRQTFAAQPVAWQRLALRRAVQTLQPIITEVSFQTIEQARLLILDKQSGTEATLPGGLIMAVAAQEITFGQAWKRTAAAMPQVNVEQPVRLPVPGKVDLVNGWTLTAEPREDVTLDEIRQNDDPWRAFVAVGADEPLWLRPSLPGERFLPLGLDGHSQLIQDLLADRKVGRGKRPLWPIVATEKNPAWIVGLHLDERARVTEKSPTIVQLICAKPNGL